MTSFFRGLVKFSHLLARTTALQQRSSILKTVITHTQRAQFHQTIFTQPAGLPSSAKSSMISLLSLSMTATTTKSTLLTPTITPSFSLGVQARRFLPTLNQVRRHKPRTKRKRSKTVVPANRRILLGPQRKGVCVKNVVRTPRKPNSAQRKCAVLRLNDGRLITAYIPGQKANLQEHGVVLFRGGRVQDCPGLKYKIIRGVYDMN